LGALFKTKCSACHGTNPTAGLTLITYAGAMAGGKDGPVINPGDSANSKIVEIQSKPHFANLSSDELNSLIQWIDAGAPEK